MSPDPLPNMPGDPADPLVPATGVDGPPAEVTWDTVRAALHPRALRFLIRTPAAVFGLWWPFHPLVDPDDPDLDSPNPDDTNLDCPSLDDPALHRRTLVLTYRHLPVWLLVVDTGTELTADTLEAVTRDHLTGVDLREPVAAVDRFWDDHLFAHPDIPAEETFHVVR